MVNLISAVSAEATRGAMTGYRLTLLRHQSSTGRAVPLVSRRGSIHIHDDGMVVLLTLENYPEAISIGIERLRA